MRTIKTGTLYRDVPLTREAIDADARTVELSFSSESPLTRWFGTEILDHSPASVRLGRLRTGGPLLVDHDTRDQVGVIDTVSIGADRKGRALVRFGRSARAEEIWQDVTDGIRQSVSVGYRIHELKLESEKDGEDTYRAVDWEPLEVSLVSIPADTSVGVGRGDPGGEYEIRVVDERSLTPPTEESHNMEPTNTTPAAPAAPAIDVREIQNQARKSEMDRVREILAIGDRFSVRDLASEAVNAGTALDAFRAQVLEKVGTHKPLTPPSADLGMNAKETKQFSIVRALNALVTGNWKGAELERDASSAVAEKMSRSPQGFFVPNDVLKRDLNVTTATAGGHTVATDLLAASFIDLLRNKMVVMKAGAQLLSGLVGNIAIPRQTGGASAFWVAESAAPTESQQAFDQVTMTPRTVGAFSDISRKLLLQSSMDIEAFVRNDLATILALEIDRVCLHGTGTAPEPRGIINVSGIGDVAGGTNGLAPAWAHIVELETDVSVANADIGTLAYITNSKVRGKLKTTEKASSTALFVWTDGASPLNGYASHVSNQVRSDLTKGTSSGVCSAIFFGNWADLIIGQWGALDIMVDPYTGSTSGTVRVVALQDVDVAVRHAESWSCMKDALTA